MQARINPYYDTDLKMARTVGAHSKSSRGSDKKKKDTINI